MERQNLRHFSRHTSPPSRGSHAQMRRERHPVESDGDLKNTPGSSFVLNVPGTGCAIHCIILPMNSLILRNVHIIHLNSYGYFRSNQVAKFKTTACCNFSLTISRLLATSAASACCVGAASHQKTTIWQFNITKENQQL